MNENKYIRIKKTISSNTKRNAIKKSFKSLAAYLLFTLICFTVTFLVKQSSNYTFIRYLIITVSYLVWLLPTADIIYYLVTDYDKNILNIKSTSLLNIGVKFMLNFTKEWDTLIRWALKGVDLS